MFWHLESSFSQSVYVLLIWLSDFFFAVATPKQIRELMQVDGLTNDEVKSHLQVRILVIYLFIGLSFLFIYLQFTGLCLI